MARRLITSLESPPPRALSFDKPCQATRGTRQFARALDLLSFVPIVRVFARNLLASVVCTILRLVTVYSLLSLFFRLPNNSPNISLAVPLVSPSSPTGSICPSSISFAIHSICLLVAGSFRQAHFVWAFSINQSICSSVKLLTTSTNNCTLSFMGLSPSLSRQPAGGYPAGTPALAGVSTF